MLEHDTGVGGRFSVLTNVGLLPAAICGLDVGAIRAGRRGCAGAGARRASRRPMCRPRSARRCRSRWPSGQDHRGDDGLCRPAGALHALVRAALGRKPRQGRQGHDADRARSARSISTASCSSSSPARATSCSPSSPTDRAGQGPRIDADLAKRRGRAGLRRQDHRRSGRGAGPRHRRDARQERLPGAHHPSRDARRAQRSANC